MAKKDIEGQLNLFEMLDFSENSSDHNSNKSSNHSQSSSDNDLEKGQYDLEQQWQSSDSFNKEPDISFVLVEGKTFVKCKECWCFDCKHNALNEAVPRTICEMEMPCPACNACMKAGEAQICTIGSADEGCSLRAAEEGIK